MATVGFIFLILALLWFTIGADSIYDSKHQREINEDVRRFQRAVEGIVKEKLTGKKDNDETN